MAEPHRILVTGATGYIGGRLVPQLLATGYAVRCLARTARKLADRPWASDPRVEIVESDFSRIDALVHAMRGCRTAFYLMPALTPAAGVDEARGQTMAQHFADAAQRAGLARIVYLRTLDVAAEGLSGPSASRRSIEDVLASGATPVTVLRAAMIIGSGSTSFEMLSYLVERLPVMVTPWWVFTECQPIAVRNVLDYLVQGLSSTDTASLTLDIGGPDVVTFAQLMRLMAIERGLRRRIVVAVPLRVPRLSALWIHLITPIPYRTAVPFVRALRQRLVCEDARAQRMMPQRLLTAREAIRRALVRTRERDVPTTWSSAGPIPGDPDWSGGTVLADRRSIDLDVPPPAVYRAVCRLGGQNGWYAAGGLWKLRGAIDRLVGGPGLRRGRRDPEDLAFGEAVDFWRVTALERNRRLRLRAEMKVPGIAELDFEIEPREIAGKPLTGDASDRTPGSRLIQTARFRPLGLAGLAYWYAMVPFHRIVFDRMLKGICGAAQRLVADTRAEPAPYATLATTVRALESNRDRPVG